MKMSVARAALAAVLASLLVASAAATPCSYSCPSGYTAIPDHYDDESSCGYACATAYKPACLGTLGQSYICGGTTGVRCPTVACTASYSAAFSGPNGCAQASSKIAAYAFSNTNFDTKYMYKEQLTDMCTDEHFDPIAAAVTSANAYAKAVAIALTGYNSYVCSCCLGNSAAYTVVASDVQAVASASAYALSEALAAVTCVGDLYTGASAISGAFAQDTQLAITGVYSKYVSKKGLDCQANAIGGAIEAAVANAVVCTFVNVYAAADVYNGDTAFSCNTDIAVSGPGVSPRTCRSNICVPVAV